MENKDNSERIERYFREQMSPEENEAFLNDLRRDKDLREETQMMALMIKEMKEEQAKQDAEISEDVQKDYNIAAGIAASEPAAAIEASIPAAATIAANQDVDRAAAKPKVIKMILWPLSIAAVIAIFYGVTLLWDRQSDSNVLFNEYYQSYNIQGASRSVESNAEKELVALFNQVGTADDVKPVIDQLQKIYDSIDSEYEYSLYADDITWYLALAYLKDDQPDKAKELLKPLAEKGNDNAIILVDKIK